MKRPFEFEGVVRMTREGVAYLLFTLIVGFAALNTGNNALYISLSLMLGTLLVSGFASKGSLRHLEIEIAGFREAWAGEPAMVVVRIRNRSRLWNVRDVILVSDQLSEPVLVPAIQRRGELSLSAEFRFERRGRIALHHIDLYTRYPLGFFLKKRRVHVGGEGIVYPRLLDRDALDRRSIIRGEAVALHRLGYGSDIYSLREYARGDSLRTVHWKKTAALGRLVVKQRELEVRRTAALAVDVVRPASATDAEFEEMLSAATTFAYQTLQRDIDVTLYLPDATIRVPRGRHGRAIYEALALVEPLSKGPLPPYGPETVVFSLRWTGDEQKTA